MRSLLFARMDFDDVLFVPLSRCEGLDVQIWDFGCGNAGRKEQQTGEGADRASLGTSNHLLINHLHPRCKSSRSYCCRRTLPHIPHLKTCDEAIHGGMRTQIVLGITCGKHFHHNLIGTQIRSHAHAINRNRALSIRSNKSNKTSSTTAPRHGFSLSSLRGHTQPELSKKLYKLIKSENHLIQAYEAAGKERISIASQLSDWGEATNDDGISDISDKVGVLLSELGEQEDLYAHNLDDSRAILKAIRNTEKSVQPSRDNKAKIADEIAKLKAKEPESTRLVTLEQELVRAEAENLVAEAQLTNIVRYSKEILWIDTDVCARLARS